MTAATETKDPLSLLDHLELSNNERHGRVADAMERTADAAERTADAVERGAEAIERLADAFNRVTGKSWTEDANGKTIPARFIRTGIGNEGFYD